MATYFGETTPGNLTVNDPIYRFRNKNKVYTCPGSGDQNLVELSAYVQDYNAGATHIRLAIYDMSNNLIYQGAAEVVVNNASWAWVGHTGITGVVLQGGTNYKIACSYDGAISIRYNIETNGNHGSTSADNTGGWPASLADDGDDDYIKSVRAGVDPVASGGPCAWLGV
jgi:hypothetical protein